MLFIICINLFITSFIGMITRYFFEYMSFIVILSIVLFYYLYDKVKNKCLKKMLEIFFIIIFCYSIFINFCLLFCENNAFYYAPTSAGNYLKTVNFLFMLPSPPCLWMPGWSAPQTGSRARSARQQSRCPGRSADAGTAVCTSTCWAVPPWTYPSSGRISGRRT